KGEDARRELVLFRGRAAFVMLNMFPYNNGHLLIAPYRHTADLASLDPAEQAEIMALSCFCTRLLSRAFTPDGFNLGMNLGRTAGAGVADHLHMHVVPRWDGDTNFMPVLAETKVLPDALYGSYDKLAAVRDRIGKTKAAVREKPAR